VTKKQTDAEQAWIEYYEGLTGRKHKPSDVHRQLYGIAKRHFIAGYKIGRRANSKEGREAIEAFKKNNE